MAWDLRSSIGNDGDNFADDVAKAQVLLNLITESNGGPSPKLLLLGQDTPEFRTAIVKFQKKNTHARDGRIDPKGGTWNTLFRMANQAVGGLLPPLPNIPAPPTPTWREGQHLRLLDQPAWQVWENEKNPLLASPQTMRVKWDIDFGGSDTRKMKTMAFETKPGSRVKYIGVAVPENCLAPKAYLVYFRHTAQAADYPTGRAMLLKGIGDHMIGRSQLPRQISASGKDVALVLPMAVGGLGEFTNDESFISNCLSEIEQALCGLERPQPPLLLGCYSDGIGEMNKFLTNCGSFRSRIKAVYDMDGALVARFAGVTLTNLPAAQVFRYVGSNLPARRPKESDGDYLGRTMGGSPAYIPLPKSRWKGHHGAKKFSSDMWWLHHYIPSCMLQHGLVSTTSL